MSLKWDLAFHSGMSAKSDLRAAVDEGIAVGVVATLLDISKTILVLPRHLDSGKAVFVDSGAFNAFQKNEDVDWTKVFMAYETILQMTDKPAGLSIVAPDVVGDQVATIGLWTAHAERIRAWIDAGARVIVPLQRGLMTAGEMLRRAKEIIGSDRFCAGIPSNLEAMTCSDAKTLRHHDFHILGRVILTPELTTKLNALQSNNPDATYTADANWLRSRLRQICRLAQAFRDNPASSSWDSSRTLAVRSVLRVDAYSSNIRPLT